MSTSGGPHAGRGADGRGWDALRRDECLPRVACDGREEARGFLRAAVEVEEVDEALLWSPLFSGEGLSWPSLFFIESASWSPLFFCESSFWSSLFVGCPSPPFVFVNSLPWTCTEGSVVSIKYDESSCSQWGPTRWCTRRQALNHVEARVLCTTSTVPRTVYLQDHWPFCLHLNGQGSFCTKW